MIELQVPPDLITILVGENGLINFLSVLPPEEILLGIKYIRSQMNEAGFKMMFDEFWKYFVNTWMKKSDHYNDRGTHTTHTSTYTHHHYYQCASMPQCMYLYMLYNLYIGTGIFLTTSWNLFHLIDENGLKKEENGMDVLINRTNNPLERFNKKLNARVPQRPSMQMFITQIKEISNEYVVIISAMLKGNGRNTSRTPHTSTQLPEIPPEFEVFKLSDSH